MAGPLRLLLPTLLSLAVLGTAIGVVYTKHESRKLFAQLQSMQKVRDHLNVEWGRLQLEQSTWATHGRIERLAHNRLGMIMPAPSAVVIVKP